MKQLSRILTTCIYLLPALGLFIYIFHPLFWSSVIDQDMTGYFYYFYKKLFFSELQSGEIPLWNPGVALGYYQVGNPLHGYFYPLNLIFLLLPFDLAYNWLILIHYLLAGLFMYLLVKSLTDSQPASLFAGFAYAFSGVMISTSKNIGFLFGAVWYPLILFCIEKYFFPRKISPPPSPSPLPALDGASKGEGKKMDAILQPYEKDEAFKPSQKASPLPRGEGMKGRVKGKSSCRYLGLLTLAFGCQFLTGDLQGFAVGIGLAIIHLIIRSHQHDPIHKAPAGFALSLGRAALPLLGSLALALGISMIQLLPLLDMAGQSYRLQGIPLEEAGYFSLNPQRLLNLFHPFFWGYAGHNTFWGEKLSNSLTMKQFWYPSIYLGIAPILLALCSLLSIKQTTPSPSPSPLQGKENTASPSNRGLAAWYLALAAAFFLMACGSFTPVWPWVYTHLPGFSLFRFPAKYFSVVNFLLVIMAGVGLANLLSQPSSRRELRIFCGGFTGLVIAIFIFFLLKHSAFEAEISSHLQINTGRALSELRHGYLTLVLFSAASAVLIFLLAFASRGKNYLIFALFVLLGIDFFLSLPPLKVTSRADFHRPPEIYSQVLSREEPHSFRLWFDSSSVPFFRTNSYRNMLVPNSALDYQIDYLFGNEPALPGRTYELCRFDNLGNLAGFINLADTKYVLTNIQQAGKPIREVYPGLSRLEPVFSDPERNALLFRKENARPRFDVMNSWEWVPSGREALQKIFSAGAYPGSPAFLEGNECLKSGRINKLEDCRDRTLFVSRPEVKSPARVKIIQYYPNRVDLEAGLPAPGLLVFNDSFYPGWQALVDGQDKEIYRSNYLFKGIFLSEGEHRVSFIFRPTSYSWGKRLSLIFLGILLAAGVLIKLKRQSK